MEGPSNDGSRPSYEAGWKPLIKAPKVQAHKSFRLQKGSGGRDELEWWRAAGLESRAFVAAPSLPLETKGRAKYLRRKEEAQGKCARWPGLPFPAAPPAPSPNPPTAPPRLLINGWVDNSGQLSHCNSLGNPRLGTTPRAPSQQQ